MQTIDIDRQNTDTINEFVRGLEAARDAQGVRVFEDISVDHGLVSALYTDRSGQNLEITIDSANKSTIEMNQELTAILVENRLIPSPLPNPLPNEGHF